MRLTQREIALLKKEGYVLRFMSEWEITQALERLEGGGSQTSQANVETDSIQQKKGEKDDSGPDPRLKR